MTEKEKEDLRYRIREEARKANHSLYNATFGKVNKVVKSIQNLQSALNKADEILNKKGDQKKEET